MTPHGRKIGKVKGKLGVLLPGMGAVTSTFIAGVESVKKGLGEPFGSVVLMGRIRLGRRDENRYPLIREFLPVRGLNDLVFGGWDIFPDSMYEVAKEAQVLTNEHLDPIKKELSAIKPYRAVFDRSFVKNLDGEWVKKGKSKRELVEQLEEDIKDFKKKNGLTDVVMVWCGSTEVYSEPKAVHKSLKAFDEGLDKSDPAISPSMMYAYAALKQGVPYANGAPHLSVDIPALRELANERELPIAGKDFKTGQTLVKTILAPGFKARMLGVNGWFSTNILGNRDGVVLHDPGSFKSKEVSKLSSLEQIFEPEIYPNLYGNISHQVNIHYYPPRGDNKEGWDNIDIFGWLGYPMQIKVNFLCRDSILAAPIVLDLALLLDIAVRAGLKGTQEWLGFYFKSPMTKPELKPVHNLFEQQAKLLNTFRYLMGEELIHHLGMVYYDEEE
ncbi:MAG: inositol-3-phosphate synthase [Myxococcota bacterium]